MTAAPLTATIAHRRSVLRERFAVWTPRTLDGWLDARAAEYADRPFVITDASTLTYAEVAARSRRYSAGLVRLGVRPGDHVGLLMANYAEFVPLKMAIARAGAVAVPFNFLYRTDEFGYVLAQSRCRLLITMTAFAALDYLAMLDAIAPGWDTPGFPERPAGDDAVPALRGVVVFRADAPVRPGTMTVADLAALGDGAPSDGAPSDGAPGLDGAVTHRPDDVADILYTSGSTGQPKGVLLTHDDVLRTAYASALTRAYEDGRRILFSLPCYHMFGYVEGLLSAMFVGGAVIMHTTFSAQGYLTAVEKHRATDLLCVPTMAIALVESPARREVDLSSLSAVLCGSAPGPIWLWEQVERDLGVSEIVTGYGMTECGGAMTLTLPEDELELTSATVGRPKLAGAAGVPGTDALCAYRAVDPLTGAPLPTGQVGELVSTGPTAMRGYYGKPAETAATLRGDWVFSGDLGRVRPDGYLELTGRAKELYKSGGELVMPREVEDVLAARPDVSQVYVVGVPDERWGEAGCAVVVAGPGAHPTERELLDHARAHLARFKVPRRVVFVAAEQLPTTATGKVQKFRLVELVTAVTDGVPS
jgi:fatty-acyl-CoA synthase